MFFFRDDDVVKDFSQISQFTSCTTSDLVFCTCWICRFFLWLIVKILSQISHMNLYLHESIHIKNWLLSKPLSNWRLKFTYLFVSMALRTNSVSFPIFRFFRGKFVNLSCIIQKSKWHFNSIYLVYYWFIKELPFYFHKKNQARGRHARSSWKFIDRSNGRLLSNFAQFGDFGQSNSLPTQWGSLYRKWRHRCRKWKNRSSWA